jgi:RNA polymerase sigma factor (sigma-70 family)
MRLGEEEDLPMTEPSFPSPSCPPLDEPRLRELLAAVRTVARRRGLASDQQSDLLSYAVCRLLERGAMPAAPSSNPRAYLETMVDRFWVDLTNELWGRWRPTAEAQRLGETAVALDRLIRRDGVEAREAVHEAYRAGRRRRTLETLDRLAQRLAPRPKPVPVEEVDRERVANGEAEVLASEQRRRLRQALTALRQELRGLEGPARRVLEGRYLEGRSARDLAHELGLEERAVYSLAYRSLEALRTRLAERGVEPGMLEARSAE